ncbi:MAG: hypothetical protein ACPGVG_17230 [Mycobacterium sp.]
MKNEDIVQRAIKAGLIGDKVRRKLLKGLPIGFVCSLPVVSRPIDQLRFDLMGVSRVPRLVGLESAPLDVWLRNAADISGDGWFVGEPSPDIEPGPAVSAVVQISRPGPDAADLVWLAVDGGREVIRLKCDDGREWVGEARAAFLDLSVGNWPND